MLCPEECSWSYFDRNYARKLFVEVSWVVETHWKLPLLFSDRENLLIEQGFLNKIVKQQRTEWCTKAFLCQKARMSKSMVIVMLIAFSRTKVWFTTCLCLKCGTTALDLVLLPRAKRDIAGGHRGFEDLSQDYSCQQPPQGLKGLSD